MVVRMGVQNEPLVLFVHDSAGTSKCQSFLITGGYLRICIKILKAILRSISLQPETKSRTLISIVPLLRNGITAATKDKEQSINNRSTIAENLKSKSF